MSGQALQPYPMTLESSAPPSRYPQAGRPATAAATVPRTGERRSRIVRQAACERGAAEEQIRKKIPCGPRPRPHGAHCCWETKREKRGGGGAEKGGYACWECRGRGVRLFCGTPAQKPRVQGCKAGGGWDEGGRPVSGRRLAVSVNAVHHQCRTNGTAAGPSACRLSALCAGGRWGQRAAPHFCLGRTHRRECKLPQAAGRQRRARAPAHSPPPPAIPSFHEVAPTAVGRRGTQRARQAPRPLAVGDADASAAAPTGHHAVTGVARKDSATTATAAGGATSRPAWPTMGRGRGGSSGGGWPARWDPQGGGSEGARGTRSARGGRERPLGAADWGRTARCGAGGLGRRFDERASTR